ncbi:MAG: hypothetical protein H0X27_00315 [Caulobacteraceae bacterium]|nr:hypothetical protein [Caulobacteraceae bacterium]
MPTTIKWKQDISGDWATIANWDLGRLPNAADDVTVNTTPLHTVTHATGTHFAHTLTVGAGVFAVSGGSLTILSSSSFANLLTISAGTLSFGGAATAANFSQSRGTVSGAGSLTVTGVASFTGPGLLHTGAGSTVLKGASTLSGPGSQFGLDGGRTLENQGTLTLTGSTQLLLGFNPFGTALGGATLTNDAGAILDLQGSGLAIARFTGATTFTNAGTLEKTVGTGGVSVGVAVANTGAIRVETGTLVIDDTLTNSGAGTMTVATGATLALAGGGSANADAFRVVGPATLEFAGGAFSLGPGTITGGGTVRVAAGVLTINGVVTVLGDFIDSDAGKTSLASGSTLLLKGGGSAKAGDLTIAAGATLDCDQFKFSLGAGAIGGTGTLSVNAGELAVKAASTVAGFFEDNEIVSGAGTFTITGPAEIQGKGLHVGPGVTVLQGATIFDVSNFGLDGGRVLENQGVFTFGSGNIRLGHNPFGGSQGGGTLRNDAGAIFDIQAPTTIVGSLGTVAFENAGTLEQTVISGVSRIEVALTNTGAVVAHGGRLDFTKAITGDGTLAVDDGATLEADGSVDGGLTMAFNGGGATLALGRPGKFDATIIGFAATDTIDLLATTATRAKLKSGDRLAIFSGADRIATLQLAGDYSGATFAVASDGAGGTNITVTGGPAPHGQPAGPPAHRFVAAMAGFRAGGAGAVEAGSHVPPAAWRSMLCPPGHVHFA